MFNIRSQPSLPRQVGVEYPELQVLKAAEMPDFLRNLIGLK
jgi:hypothetical protein